MTDYREYAQQYAQGGIKAVVILNGGAAVALLTQLGGLSALAKPVLVSMSFRSGGLVCGALTWLLAFAATRNFDEWHQTLSHDATRADGYRVNGNSFQLWATITALLSLGLFVTGCLCLAVGYAEQYASPS